MSEFSGPDVTEDDKPRITAQQKLVLGAMLDGNWWTLEGLRQTLEQQGVTAALTGVSARVRCLRKPEWGSYNVERRRVTQGIWEYRISGVNHERCED